MSKSSSFDIESTVDLQMVDNAVVQANKEVITRYDFKGTDSSITRNDTVITLFAADDMKLRAMTDILQLRLVKAGISLKFLDYGKAEAATKGYLRQLVTIKQGISKEDGKKIIQTLKDAGLKVQASIQGDVVRVNGKSRDELQEAISALKEADLPVALTFTNYR
jgi:uncharacterized protein YajQ (UPF0234 family)